MAKFTSNKNTPAKGSKPDMAETAPPNGNGASTANSDDSDSDGSDGSDDKPEEGPKTPTVTVEEEIAMFERLEAAETAYDLAAKAAEERRQPMVDAYGEIFEKVGAGPWTMADGSQMLVGKRMIKGSKPERYNYFRKAEIPVARKPGVRPAVA